MASSTKVKIFPESLWELTGFRAASFYLPRHQHRSQPPLRGQHGLCSFAVCRGAHPMQDHWRDHEENGGVSLQIQSTRKTCTFSCMFLLQGRTKHVSLLILSPPGTFGLLLLRLLRTLGNNLLHFSWTLATADNIFRLAWQPNKPCLASRSRTLAICSFPDWYLSHQHFFIPQIQHPKIRKAFKGRKKNAQQ